MKSDRFASAARLSVVLLFSLGVAAPAGAQVLKPCAGEKPGTCVEFTARYYKDNQKGNAPDESPRVVLMDGGKPAVPECTTNPKGKPNLKLCEAATPGFQRTNASRIDLRQTTKNPYCYQVCNDGWCWDECF